jgi:hypothetical protein
MCKRLSRNSALLPWGEHQLAAATIVLHEPIGATIKLALSVAARGWEYSIIVIMRPARIAEALLPRSALSRLIFYRAPLRTSFARPT